MPESEKKEGLVPYNMVELGFEAVYTGEKSSFSTERAEGNATLITDEAGNVVEKWSTWTWTWPGQEKDWDDEVEIKKHAVEILNRIS